MCPFVIRTATAAWPDGIKTQSMDECAAVSDTTAPAARVLAYESCECEWCRKWQGLT